MNLYVTLFTIALTGAMIAQSFRALSQAHKRGRCAKPYVMPVFAGVASIIISSLVVLDMTSPIKTPRDLHFGLQVIIAALSFAVFVLVTPNTKKRVP